MGAMELKLTAPKGSFISLEWTTHCSGISLSLSQFDPEARYASSLHID